MSCQLVGTCLAPVSSGETLDDVLLGGFSVNVATKTAFLILFAFQLWSERSSIQGASWHRVVDFVKGFVSRDRPPEVAGAFFEIRMNVCRTMMAMARRIAPCVLGLDLFFDTNGLPSGHRSFLTVFYGCCLLFDVDLLRQKPWLVDAPSYCMYAFMSLNLVLLPCSPAFFTFSSRRAVVGLYAGILFCDTRKAAVCSLGMFALKMRSFPRQAQCLFRTDVMEGVDPYWSYFQGEFVAFCVSVVICYIVEQWINDCLWSLLEKKTAAENSKMAASVLLSALCDADLALDRELRIVGPCTRLVQLLSSAFLTHSTRVLDGLDFPSMLDEADQPRFCHFIEASVQGGGCFAGYQGIAPPSSIQVRIDGGNGSQGVKVELFLVSLPDCNEAGQPCHLIGLKDASEVPGLGFNSPEHTRVSPAASENAAVLTESSEQQGLLRGATSKQDPAEDSHRPARMTPSSTQASFESGQRSSARRATSDSSSEASRSSGYTTRSAQVDEVDMPEIKSISVEIDAGSPDLTIFSVTIAFNVDAFQQGNLAAGRPCLNTWLTEDSKSPCKDWLLAVVNEWYNGRLLPDLCPRLSLHYPGQDPGLRLAASTVEAEEVEEEEEDTDVPSSGIALRLKLSNFTYYRTQSRAAPLRFSRRRLRRQLLQEQQQQNQQQQQRQQREMPHAMPSIDEDAAVSIG
ncbi:unnamed protein product [Polarella glacialis]|uniref:Uncharacterized protein n=1 Tax=Polarella glacialis TaxID=89957 RepID=A0A813HC21_POLGL|nr:unnamed protein product [Polarella glacialis]